jgi:hypothetical protein
MLKFKFKGTASVKKVMENSQSNVQEFSEEQEMLSKIPEEISSLEKKMDKDRHLLSLMRSIKNYSGKEGKSPEEIAMLNGMITMYAEKKNDWSQYENTTESKLNGNKSEPAIDNSLFSQKLQAVKLKPVKKNEIQQEQAVKEKNGLPAFIIDQKDLASITLKSANRNNSVTSSHDEEKLSELDKILAKQRALLETENIISTVSATDEESSSEADSEEKLDDFDFFEKVCNATGFSINEPDTSIRFINALSKIYEDKTRPNSSVDELDELLKTLQEFIDEQDYEIKKPQAPLSMYFKSSHEDKPVIVEEILKPKI